MAKCPKCNTSQNFVRLITINSQDEIECPGCGTKLRVDRKSSSMISGIFFLSAVIAYVPNFNFSNPSFWVLLTIPPFVIMWVFLLKLEIVVEVSDDPSVSDVELLKKHIEERRRVDLVLILIPLIVMAIWLYDVFAPDSEIGDLVLASLIVLMVGCLLGLNFKRCIFCKKITPCAQGRKTCRYCKKRINI